MTLGNVVELVGLVVLILRLYYGAIGRFTALEQTLRHHADTLVQHSERMEKHESGMLNMVREVAIVIGRMDSRESRRENR